ncbi:hypothetical protein GIB67_024507 [Kingdonia uniflora]|uniref:CRM domain-containing protein n=1 Tax=Kingdonia uniflora TaxID=39325 RepID=A0A7J7LP18_9MAGN|nr:hypothetical protein GIB67_024507 [Kingdonia uniflora]
MGKFSLGGRVWIHSSRVKNKVQKGVKNVGSTGNGSEVAGGDTNGKVKRKKLKGKRAVVKWLKHFRFKKKKEYERMTAEEKILFKLRKARNKEDRLVTALKKIEPPESSEAIHDPEILTPEEHFYFLKMGLKCKNYVPIGVRGVYNGVILNMHLHWKKHQTLQVKVKTFTTEEVKEIAVELARLSGGIVLGIHEEYTIVMYRGKNYFQPPAEIMSPKIILSRKKALDKSKYVNSLRAVRNYIPKLEQELELFPEKAKRREDIKTGVLNEDSSPLNSGEMTSGDNLDDEDSTSESEALSDIFETDSDGDVVEEGESPLYLDSFEKFPKESNGEPDDFNEHLRQITDDLNRADPTGKNVELLELDEVDRMVLRVGSLVKKNNRR